MNNFQIESIKVEKLFGLYDYVLTKSKEESDNLIILYGDNGTGKSTILRIIYYLFSTQRNVGHKSQIANIAFKKIEIKLICGDIVIAERNNENGLLVGSYNLSYIRKDKVIVSCFMKSRKKDENGEYSIPASSDEKDDREYDKFLSMFQNLSILYISDNRKEINVAKDEAYNSRRIDRTFRIDLHEDRKEEEIEKEIDLLQEWIINRALSATKKGEEGTSDIYTKILLQFSKNRKNKQTTPSIDEIRDRILSIAEKTESYVAMGFISQPDYQSVLSVIEKVQPQNVESVHNILSPYMEMQENKLSALDDLVETISHFNNSLNKYLYRKTINYSVSNGFEIKPLGMNEAIDLRNLSSGEKQLILLFSMVIRKSEDCPIIIIDEPEISLNIKWQRMLMDTLQYFVKNSNTQFIIATHSFELLSSHTRDTIKLVSKDIEA